LADIKGNFFVDLSKSGTGEGTRSNPFSYTDFLAHGGIKKSNQPTKNLTYSFTGNKLNVDTKAEIKTRTHINNVKVILQGDPSAIPPKIIASSIITSLFEISDTIQATKSILFRHLTLGQEVSSGSFVVVEVKNTQSSDNSIDFENIVFFGRTIANTKALFSTTTQGIYTFKGCTFAGFGTSVNTENAILADTSAQATIIIRGCQFEGFVNILEGDSTSSFDVDFSGFYESVSITDGGATFTIGTNNKGNAVGTSQLVDADKPIATADFTISSGSEIIGASETSLLEFDINRKQRGKTQDIGAFESNIVTGTDFSIMMFDPLTQLARKGLTMELYFSGVAIVDGFVDGVRAVKASDPTQSVAPAEGNNFGTYVFKDVPSGRYDVVASAPGVNVQIVREHSNFVVSNE